MKNYFILTDENGKVISWNKLVEDLLSMSHDDLYMKPVEALYPPEEWKRIQSEYMKNAGIKRRIETKIIRKVII